MPILYKKKNDILNMTKEKKIESKFVKMFVRYDYIGNVYCYSVDKYVKHIEDNYNKFMNCVAIDLKCLGIKSVVVRKKKQKNLEVACQK